MNKTSFEQGIERERRAALRELLEHRFGALAPAVPRRLEEVPAEELQSLRIAAWEVHSLAVLGL